MTPTDPREVVEAAIGALPGGNRESATLNAYLAALHRNGWLYTDLADILGVTRQAITQRVARANKAEQPVDLEESGLPIPPAPPPREPAKPSGQAPELPEPDYAATRARARAYVADRIGDATGRDLLDVASRITNDAHAHADKARNDRDRAAVAWKVYGGRRLVRREAGIASRESWAQIQRRLLGLDPGEFAKMTTAQQIARAEARGVPHLPDPARVLQDARNRYLYWAEVKAAAMRVRDDAIRDVVDSTSPEPWRHGKMTPREAADLTGRNRSRVWHILGKADVA